jgi:tetratricopeptide (TPR) repeat protein
MVKYNSKYRISGDWIMIDYESIDKKIMAGYEYLMKGNTVNACDAWLDAWEGIKTAIVEAQVKNIEELQVKYEWTQFLSNYIQDLEAELHNAGLSNKEYFQKRITYCEEMLELCGAYHGLLVENTRRAVADSHYSLGEKEKCDNLYSTWLEQNPDWGWGYIGWSDCYWFDKSKDTLNLKKSEEILKRALLRESIHDRFDVLERAIDLYEELGKHKEAAVLKEEAKTFARLNTVEYNIPIRSEKVGRNDPCPCGSGKKYKKCCGK